MTAALLYAITGIIYARHARRNGENLLLTMFAGLCWFPIFVWIGVRDEIG